MKKLILLSLVNAFLFVSCSNSDPSKQTKIKDNKTETIEKTDILSIDKMPNDKTKSLNFKLIPSKINRPFIQKWQEVLNENGFEVTLFRYEKDNNLKFHNCVNNSIINLQGEAHITFEASKEKGILDGAPTYTFFTYQQIDFKNKADADKFIRLYNELNTPKNKECFINQKHRILQEEGKVSIFYSMHKEAEQHMNASADLFKELNKGAQLIE